MGRYLCIFSKVLILLVFKLASNAIYSFSVLLFPFFEFIFLGLVRLLGKKFFRKVIVIAIRVVTQNSFLYFCLAADT
jgi:hypothetical protein